MSKIVKTFWFNEVGIVKCYDEITKKNKYYIGKCLNISEETDTQYIKMFGTPFFPERIK